MSLVSVLHIFFSQDNKILRRTTGRIIPIIQAKTKAVLQPAQKYSFKSYKEILKK